MNTNINTVWANIIKYQNETFWTQKKNLPYTYRVEDDYVVVPEKGRIPKKSFEKALQITNPIPSKIGGWGPSYICGIITDNRIISEGN